jgi:hypothetical protein
MGRVGVAHAAPTGSHGASARDRSLKESIREAFVVVVQLHRHLARRHVVSGAFDCGDEGGDR